MHNIQQVLVQARKVISRDTTATLNSQRRIDYSEDNTNGRVAPQNEFQIDKTSYPTFFRMRTCHSQQEKTILN